MSEQHNQGRIRYDFEDGYCGELIASDGTCIATFIEEPSAEDARRIVASWNACDGISTERLEDLGRPLLQHLIGCDERAERMVKERAAMLAALVLAREFISTDRNAFADAAMPPDGRPMEPADAAELADFDAALLQINEAIEKAGAE